MSREPQTAGMPLSAHRHHYLRCFAAESRGPTASLPPITIEETLLQGLRGETGKREAGSLRLRRECVRSILDGLVQGQLKTTPPPHTHTRHQLSLLLHKAVDSFRPREGRLPMQINGFGFHLPVTMIDRCRDDQSIIHSIPLQVSYVKECYR